MTTDYKVTELFCIIDEFCKHFDAENVGNLLLDSILSHYNIKYHHKHKADGETDSAKVAMLTT